MFPQKIPDRDTSDLLMTRRSEVFFLFRYNGVNGLAENIVGPRDGIPGEIIHRPSLRQAGHFLDFFDRGLGVVLVSARQSHRRDVVEVVA